MNELSGGEAMVRMLQRHGVRYIFGLCGDTSLPFYDALYRLDHGITHVLCRDERSAAYMADAYARFSGNVGVCEGPSGGGATYILPGVVEANESSVAVLAITTDIAVTSRGRFALTELDQAALFAPLTKWNASIDRSDRLPSLVRSAFRHMTTGRPGAAHLAFPFDVQKAPVDEAGLWAEPELGRYPARRVCADRAAIEAAAEVLLSAHKPLFICGGGPLSAGAQTPLGEIAERLDAPVATTISGQGVISDHHPLALGVVGSNGGTPETRALVDDADLVVFVGCRAGSVTTERWQHPAPGATRIVHIDVDPGTVGANYAPEVAVVGDALLVLQALSDTLESMQPAMRSGSRRAQVASAKQRKFAAFEQLAASNETPILPERIVAALQKALPADALVIADPGTPCPYLSAYLNFDTAARRLISNRAHGALGYALPAAVGACFARPHARCVSVMGDGSFGFAVGELETIVRLDLPITMVVISNSSFGWIKAGQRSGFDERYYSVDFSRSDHARIAEAFGVKAWRVEDPRALDETLRQALAHDGPALVDILTQPLHQARAPVSEWVA